MGIQINGQTDTISALDNNFSLAGNVSIGGTLTYEDVTSVDAVGLSTFQAGIHIDDSIAHLGDTNTKIRFPANDTFTVETAGSERVRITSGGNVGINCTPTERFHINGGDGDKFKLDCPNNYSNSSSIIMSQERGEIKTTIDASGGNPGGTMVLRTRNTAGTMIDAITIENSQQVSINSAAGTHPLTVSNGGTQRLRITSAGNIGIGTDNPQGKLVVSDGSNGLEFNPNSNNAIVSYNRTTSAYAPNGLQGSTVQLRIGGVGTALHVHSDGKVGIGTDNPSKTLTVYGDSSSSFRISKSGVLAYDHTFDGSTYTIANNNGSAGIPIIIGTKTAGGESLRITSAGLVGIGTDNPNQELHIHANGTSYVRFTDEASGTGATDGVVFGLDHPHLYAWNYEAGDFVVATNATEKLRITSAGISQFTATGRVATFTGNGIEINNSLGSNVFIGTQSGTEGKMGTVNNANMSLFTNNNYAKRAELQTSGSFSILDGDLIVANGHGINFGSTTPDGTTPSSEILDDYEEGTWTPTLPNGGTMITVYNARYTKIGRLVNLYCYINTGSIPSNGTEFRIGGLPFNCANGQYYPSGSIGYTASFNFDPWRPLARTNDNFIYFHRCDGNQTVAVNSNASGLAALLITLTYGV